MCNLYSITTNQAAIIALFRVMNRYVGNLPPMPGVFPDYPAPVVRNAGADRSIRALPRFPGCWRRLDPRGKSAPALEITRRAVHRGNRRQAADNSETANDLMSGEVNAFHCDGVQHDTK
jgi:hypothetical protein